MADYAHSALSSFDIERWASLCVKLMMVHSWMFCEWKKLLKFFSRCSRSNQADCIGSSSVEVGGLICGAVSLEFQSAHYNTKAITLGQSQSALPNKAT